ncbi:MAG: NADH-quinone oxidoreductase subunit NuoN, partial [Hyphomicrobiales bacterium]|nr:NADH-quinone oxidoreductase subunit NuoN [Hyphomicrobiales bacterium]
LGAWRGERAAWIVAEAAIAALGIAAVMLVMRKGGVGARTFFHGAFVDDAFARFMQALSLVGGAVSLLLSFDWMRRRGIGAFEYPVLVLLATLGMMVLAAAGDLIALYVGLELMSLALYVAAAFDRDDGRATEAGLKYFMLGALSSGMLLYGASLIYGFAGSTAFDDIARAAQGHVSLGLAFGVAFLLAGLAFKISAAPFHMWTPDVYEGAPTPVTAFFASAPKMAAMAALVRVTTTAFPGAAADWRQIVVFVSILSMAIGGFGALGQRNFKRLMAYSSIGHMGFALVGLAAGSQAGVQGVLVYMAIYLAMTLGTFAAILLMRRGGAYVESIDDLAGLSKTDPATATFLTLLMFSLAGVPPLAGFFAKYYVFTAAIQAGLFSLATVGVLLSVVSAVYYLRIVKLMWFDEPKAAFDAGARAPRWTLALATAVVGLFFLLPAPLVDAALAAARALLPA